jgi:hypothetical protein
VTASIFPDPSADDTVSHSETEASLACQREPSPPILSSSVREIADYAIVTRLASTLWLAAPLTVLLASALLQLGTDRDVLLPWGRWVIPETCAMHARLGVDCPGCGLTRSFIHLAHGRAKQAWELNPVSLGLFAFVVAQIPLAFAYALRLPWRRLETWTRWNQIMLMSLMAALMLQWLWRLVRGELTS